MGEHMYKDSITFIVIYIQMLTRSYLHRVQCEKYQSVSNTDLSQWDEDEYYIIWEVSLANNMIFVEDWSIFNLSLHSLYSLNHGRHKVKKHMWKVREVQQIYTKTLMSNYIITSLSTLFFTLYYVVILDLHLKGQWFNNLLL